MKKLMLLAVLCICSIATRAAGYEYLVFTLTDGTTKAVTASNLTIQFADGYLLAKVFRLLQKEIETFAAAEEA